MTHSGTESSKPEPGVYYRPSDYAGLPRRLVIMVIDGFVLLLVGVATGLLWATFNPKLTTWPASCFFAWAAAGYLYLVVAKSAGLGTVGYMLTGVKIVNLQGQRPSLMAMTVRVLWLGLSALTVVTDLLWLVNEPNKQALRD